MQTIYGQMEQHYVEKATAYEVHVSRGFTTMRPVNCTSADEDIRDFRMPLDQKKNIRAMLFGGFTKCLYQVQKFDSDTERRFASILEKDSAVQKWCKPPSDALKIDYSKNNSYEPDFVVETATTKYVCETKSVDEMQSDEVKAKARAASIWCDNATKHGGGKPWKYLLVPHDKVDDSKSLEGLGDVPTRTLQRHFGRYRCCAARKRLLGIGSIGDTAWGACASAHSEISRSREAPLSERILRAWCIPFPHGYIALVRPQSVHRAVLHKCWRRAATHTAS